MRHLFRQITAHLETPTGHSETFRDRTVIEDTYRTEAFRDTCKIFITDHLETPTRHLETFEDTYKTLVTLQDIWRHLHDI